DDFFISIYAGSSVWSDVGKDTSLWKMVLTYPGGGEARPISIQKVKSNPLQRMFYPYVDKWSHTYEARFDKFLPEGLKEFSLSFVGIPATSKLVWKGLKPVPTDRGEIVRKTKTQKIR
ncbi:MAG: hypothetical protein Q7S98_03100, partial [Deltaproteobacteria bacterium]|nr:hypothetical protein [Deltaproteobacteria bacterium]